MAEHYKNYIDGRWIEAKSRKTFENRNSANKNDLIGLFPLLGPGGVHQAVSAAKKAFPKVNDKNFFFEVQPPRIREFPNPPPISPPLKTLAARLRSLLKLREQKNRHTLT